MSQQFEKKVSNAAAAVSMPSNSVFNIGPPTLKTSNNMPLAWRNFVSSLKIYLRASGLEKEPDTRKVAILLSLIGEDAMEVYYSFNVDLDTVKFEDLIKKFECHYMPKVNVVIERHKLFNRKQRTDEDIETFSTDLKNISLNCNLGPVHDDLLKDIFSWNLLCQNTKERILADKPKTFEAAVELAKHIRNSRLDSGQLRIVYPQEAVAVVSHKQDRHRPLSPSRQSRQPVQVMYKRQSSQSRTRQVPDNKCHRCGQVHRVRCPAQGKTCRKCHKMNHFASVCRQQVNVVQLQDSEDNGQENNNLHLGLLTVNSVSNSTSYHVKLNINMSSADFLLDTGADTNILSYNTFKALNLNTDILYKNNDTLSTIWNSKS